LSVAVAHERHKWLHGARLCECCLDRIVAGCQIRQGSGCKGLALTLERRRRARGTMLDGVLACVLAMVKAMSAPSMAS
jgi:hypothetical protein